MKTELKPECFYASTQQFTAGFEEQQRNLVINLRWHLIIPATEVDTVRHERANRFPGRVHQSIQRKCHCQCPALMPQPVWIFPAQLTTKALKKERSLERLTCFKPHAGTRPWMAAIWNEQRAYQRLEV